MTAHVALWMVAAALAASPEGVVAGRLVISAWTSARATAPWRWGRSP